MQELGKISYPGTLMFSMVKKVIVTLEMKQANIIKWYWIYLSIQAILLEYFVGS